MESNQRKMKPFKFKYNRVRRSYTGGKGIDLLRHAQSPVDGEYPEDWIASAVKACPRPGEPDDAGISIIDEMNTTFLELLENHAQELLGPGHVKTFGCNTGFLMKLLDSAIRLPIQVHPDKKTATKLFSSSYGKTEAWLILDTRPVNDEKPYLLIGFNEKLDKDVFIRESIAGELHLGLDMMHKIEVEPGDIFMIPGGLPHAIGLGLTLIEIMEPSDWIVVSERYCGDIVIPDSRRFNGLTPEKSMDMFDFTPVSYEQLMGNCHLKPTPCDSNMDTLIDRDSIKYFGLQQLSLCGTYNLENRESCCRAGIVVKGQAILGELHLNTGDTFFLPAAMSEYGFHGNAEIVLALPPIY